MSHEDPTLEYRLSDAFKPNATNLTGAAMSAGLALIGGALLYVEGSRDSITHLQPILLSTGLCGLLGYSGGSLINYASAREPNEPTPNDTDRETPHRYERSTQRRVR